MAGALEHVRVVELADDVAAASCGRQFAMWGAEVLRYEPGEGTRLQGARPVVDGTSLLWTYLTANKGIVGSIDDGLVASTDVLVTDWGPERLAASGVEVRPELVVVRISDFGSDGPYRTFLGTDLVLQALTGYMSVNGKPGRPPLRAPANIVPTAIGVSAFVGALAALRERSLSGTGQTVEVSAIDAVASLVLYTRTEYTGRPEQRRGGVLGPPMLPCRDGHIFFNYAAPRALAVLLDLLGLDADRVPEDPGERATYLAEHTRTRGTQELFDEIGARGHICGIAQDLEALLAHPHLEARRFFTDLEGMRFPGPPARMSRTPASEPCPAREVPPAWPARPGVRSGSATSEQPLTGVRVLDFTQAWLGPYATMLLADLGADVVKIESHRRPDVWRVLAEIPPCAAEHAHKWNVSCLTNAVNRNKRSLALDLGDERAREIVRQLAADADLVMENYTPRVMERFGLTYDRLREVNPRLVVVSFSGYGKTGPYTDLKANGASIEPTAGWTSLFGYPDDEPFTMGEYPVDAVAGLHMAGCALAALLHRDRTGEGQAIDGSMIESAAAYIGEELMRAAAAPGSTARHGNRHADLAPHDVYPCAGDDSWVAVAVRDDVQWRALRSLVADPALDDRRFDTVEGRRRHADEIDRAIASWTCTLAAREVMSRLQTAGVAAGVVQDTQQAMDDPHLAGWFVHMHHPDLGTHRYPGFPWTFSRTPPRAQLPPPRLGEHLDEILRGALRLSDGEVETLFADEVTGAKLTYVPKGRT